jgi:hypothetical protein
MKKFVGEESRSPKSPKVGKKNIRVESKNHLPAEGRFREG